jgi:hypothetical protein
MPDTPVTTLRDAHLMRESCETEMLHMLKKLCALTGMDLDRVQVLTVVTQSPDADAPQVVPYAVRIVLSV